MALLGFFGSNFTSNERTLIKRGIENWNEKGLKNKNGGPLISLVHWPHRDSNGNRIPPPSGKPIVLVEHAGITAGQACFPSPNLANRVYIQPATSAGLPATAFHEFGHLMGIAHTGHLDSFDQSTVFIQNPSEAMATNITGYNGTRKVRQDDIVQLTHKHDSRPVGARRRSITANPGFEYLPATRYWQRTHPLVSVGNATGNSYQGLRHGRFRPTIANKGIRSITNFTPVPGLVPFYDARFAVRTAPGVVANGQTKIALYMRTQPYVGSSTSFNSGRNENVRLKPEGPLMMRSIRRVTATPQWQVKRTAEAAAFGLAQPTDVYLMIFSDQQANGQFVDIYIDSAETRVRNGLSQ